ncbi:hypothetical protein B0H13DRAFT_2332198 [Mycena leptocephala]|nr:hypothetical protein B0H13DRAFT_2332198 [Mycena leptocephala]
MSRERGLGYRACPSDSISPGVTLLKRTVLPHTCKINLRAVCAPAFSSSSRMSTPARGGSAESLPPTNPVFAAASLWSFDSKLGLCQTYDADAGLYRYRLVYGGDPSTETS